MLRKLAVERFIGPSQPLMMAKCAQDLHELVACASADAFDANCFVHHSCLESRRKVQQVFAVTALLPLLVIVAAVSLACFASYGQLEASVLTWCLTDGFDSSA